MISIEFNNMML